MIIQLFVALQKSKNEKCKFYHEILTIIAILAYKKTFCDSCRFENAYKLIMTL